MSVPVHVWGSVCVGGGCTHFEHVCASYAMLGIYFFLLSLSFLLKLSQAKKAKNALKSLPAFNENIVEVGKEDPLWVRTPTTN